MAHFFDSWCTNIIAANLTCKHVWLVQRCQVFEGNTDAYSTHYVYLNEPVMARFVKFHTLTWHQHPSMRVEIIGCQGACAHLPLYNCRILTHLTPAVPNCCCSNPLFLIFDIRALWHSVLGKATSDQNALNSLHPLLLS